MACFKENTVSDKPVLIVTFGQEIVAHVFYRQKIEFLTMKG
jgi:hypothetical protein